MTGYVVRMQDKDIGNAIKWHNKDAMMDGYQNTVYFYSLVYRYYFLNPNKFWFPAIGKYTSESD